MSRYGWCVDGHHEGCPHTVPKFVVDEKNRVHLIGESRCGCECHED